MSRTRRRVAPALGLFALAPLIGECLLGDLTVTEIVFFLLPLLAPMYGGGALLIREVARRTGRGPATMLVLGVAYGLVEEGLADQMLFNRDYAGHDLMGDTYVPGLGVGGWLTIGVVTMHAVWSTNVVIALAESLVPGRAETSWLGRTGLVVTGAVFLAGTVPGPWAIGALLAYAGGSFATGPESAPEQGADYVVNAVLAVAAIGLLVVAARRSSSRPLAPAGLPVAGTRERRAPGERQYER